MKNQQMMMSDVNILVVDDTPDNLRLLASLLSEQGYIIRPAASGSQALRAAREERPNLILLDVKMPEMDGYEVCERLKADEDTHDIPVIFISALGGLRIKSKGLRLGESTTSPNHFRPKRRSHGFVRTSIGLEARDMITEHQLRGTVEFHRKTPGTEIMVRFKEPYYKPRIAPFSGSET